MKLGFPYYVTSFPCECTVQEATERIWKAVAWPGNDLKMKEASYSGRQKMVLHATTRGVLGRNSFLPMITVEIAGMGGETRVYMTFELKKSIKTMTAVFSVYCILFEAMLLPNLFTAILSEDLSTLLSSCLPLGLMAFSWAMDTIGLRFSSREPLWTLFDALTQGSKERLPKIHR